MPAKKDRNNGRTVKFEQLYEGLANSMPGLGRLLLVGPTTELSIQVKQRAEYDWLVVVKMAKGGEGPVVLFGVGVGPVEAMLHADGQVQAGRWREDKPWEGN